MIARILSSDLGQAKFKGSLLTIESLAGIAGHLKELGFDKELIDHNLKELNKKNEEKLENDTISTIANIASEYGEPKPTDPLTDMWNADFFMQNYGKNLRYSPSMGWFLWQGIRWKIDETLLIVKLAKDAIRKMLTKGDKNMQKHAIRSQGSDKINSMINLSKSECAMKNEDFDSDNYLLNCLNGTLNLETLALKKHNRRDYITKLIDLNYNPEAQCPEWINFLNSIFLNDIDIIHFMQKALGYSLSGSMIEQCIFILYGIGSNGKSTFLNHIYKILGDYSMNTPSSALIEKYQSGVSNDIARLKGARFVTASESGKNKALDENQIKQLTSGDAITARFLYKENFEFYPTFKIFLATNYKPEIKGQDKGIWRRIYTIPFDKTIESNEIDREIDSRLLKEHEGILAWMVEGFKMWQSEGLHPIPERMANMKEEYREDSDILGNFLEDECIIEADREVYTSEIFERLQVWAKKNGFRRIRKPEWINYMNSKLFIKERSRHGETRDKTVWSGIGLKEERKREWQDNY